VAIFHALLYAITIKFTSLKKEKAPQRHHKSGPDETTLLKPYSFGTLKGNTV